MHPLFIGILACALILALLLIGGLLRRHKKILNIDNQMYHREQNDATLYGFKKTYNSLLDYLTFLQKHIPLTLPEVQHEKQRISAQIIYLKNLIDVIEQKHDLNTQISIYQWSFYIQAARNISDNKITLKEILERPPIPEEGNNTVVADYVQNLGTALEKLRGNDWVKDDARESLDMMTKLKQDKKSQDKGSK